MEMQTTADEKQKIREIIQHLIDGDRQWISDNWILAGNKSGQWVLNYLQGPRNEYNRLVRGMVVQQPPQGWKGDPLTLIKSFPFTRFFNQGEKDGAAINFGNAEMLEKMDGTMVGVYFPEANPANPQFHTRKMLSVDQQDMSRTLTSFGGKEYKFMPIIGSYVKKLKFSPEDAEHTYVFEFVHEASYVMTKYDNSKYGLYLLGARHIPSHQETTEQELDKIAQRIGSLRPRRWDALASRQEIEAMMKDLAKTTADFEGFVFRDRDTGNRLKVKDTEYVRKHHLIDKGKSFGTLLSMILQGEEDEVVAYMPHFAPRVEEVKAKYREYLDKAVTVVQQWQSKGFTNRKDLALPLFGQQHMPPQPGEKDRFLRTQILKNYEVRDEQSIRNNIDNAMKEVALGSGKNAGQPKELASIIGLNDDDVEKQPDVSEL